MIGSQLPLPVQLRDTASFDTFVAGPNADVVTTLRQSAGSALLFGPSGSGRTHLLQAVCRARGGRYWPLATLRELGPEILEGGSGQAPLLCLDDVDAVADDRSWALALLRVLDTCRSEGRELLLSSTAPPDRLQLALPDLRTRMSALPAFGLRLLGDIDLLHLLQQRAAAKGLALPDDVARWLLNTQARGAGPLLSALERLDRAALSAKRRLTLPFVQSVLAPAAAHKAPD